jgi:hypothetical protein
VPGKLLGRSEGSPGHPDTPGNEALAMAGIRWLAEQRRAGAIPDALVLANHLSRLGIDSPHELRAWRDAALEIVIGVEGAPGAGRRSSRLGRAHQHPRREPAHGAVLARLPGRGVRHLRRVRLDDRDRRRAVGRAAVRGHAVLDHHQLRQSPHGQGHPA